MRVLGDAYIKAGQSFPDVRPKVASIARAEFRNHQKVDNPLHIMGFLSQWKVYLDELPTDPSQPFTGRRLDPTMLEKVRDTHMRGIRPRKAQVSNCTDVCRADRATIRTHARDEGRVEASATYAGG